MKIIAALCLLVIVWVAVKSKVRIKTRRGYRGVELPTEARTVCFRWLLRN